MHVIDLAMTLPALHQLLHQLCAVPCLQGPEGGREGSLLAFLDHCASAAGRRRLRQWLCRPLARVSEIEERLVLVDLLGGQQQVAGQLQVGSASKLRSGALQWCCHLDQNQDESWNKPDFNPHGHHALAAASTAVCKIACMPMLHPSTIMDSSARSLYCRLIWPACQTVRSCWPGPPRQCRSCCRTAASLAGKGQQQQLQRVTLQSVPGLLRAGGTAGQLWGSCSRAWLPAWR